MISGTYPGVILTLALLAATAAAGPIELDQSQDLVNGAISVTATANSTQSRIQVFTPDKSGTIDSVEIQLMCWGSGSNHDGTAHLDILTAIGGIPDTGNVLGSVSLPTSALPQAAPYTYSVSALDWVVFDLSSLGISQSAGDDLAFRLRPEIDTDNFARFYFGKMGQNPYTPGNQWLQNVAFGNETLSENTNADLVFRIFVEVAAGSGSAAVPLPAGGWLGLGMLGLIGFARRLRRRGTGTEAYTFRPKPLGAGGCFARLQCALRIGNNRPVDDWVRRGQSCATRHPQKLRIW